VDFHGASPVSSRGTARPIRSKHRRSTGHSATPRCARRDFSKARIGASRRAPSRCHNRLRVRSSMKVPITRSPRVHACAFAVAVCAAAHVSAAAATPRLETNEAYIEAVTRPADLSTSDVMAVFAFVFASLPDRVKVYPTEDYYYFRFYAGGV